MRHHLHLDPTHPPARPAARLDTPAPRQPTTRRARPPRRQHARATASGHHEAFDRFLLDDRADAPSVAGQPAHQRFRGRIIGDRNGQVDVPSEPGFAHTDAAKPPTSANGTDASCSATLMRSSASLSPVIAAVWR
jgi:hypothetical protein